MEEDFSTYESRLQLAKTSEDPDVLRSLASDPSWKIRVAAVLRIKDRIDLEAIVNFDRTTPVIQAAIHGLNMQATAYCA